MKHGSRTRQGCRVLAKEPVNQPLMSGRDRPISIIIPTLNEAETLPQTLKALQNLPHVEVIVVDGGSLDDTVRIAVDWNVRVVCSAAGRAHQMNVGAAVANGDILLFLHADTVLPRQFDRLVRQTLMQPRVIAGAFKLAIDGHTPGLRLVEWGVNMRSRLCQMPYGDQAIHLPATTFRAIGGFPELPIMEDFALVQQLRQHGRIAIVPDKVLTSGRRWQKLGVFHTTAVNQLIILGYQLGVSPTLLAHWYRSLGK